MRQLSFAKGHGTKNDFVIVTDRNGVTPLSEEDVRWLCDRRAGIGADGLLRVIKAAHAPGWDGDPQLWFMDYRNADGSIAEMCGNGLRVFASFLREEDLISSDSVLIATRAGARKVSVYGDGNVQIEMGAVTVGTTPVTVTVGDRSWRATPVDVGNPHAVAVVDQVELRALDLTRPPAVDPASAFPEGVNVEFIAPGPEFDLDMRVFERGVGETHSCGTGTVAAAAAAGIEFGWGDGTYRVQVPGGTLFIELSDRRAWLTGPAVIVARGEVSLPGN
jgi:diaminopimelate epimerase